MTNAVAEKPPIRIPQHVKAGQPSPNPMPSFRQDPRLSGAKPHPSIP
jgi:hypothetical protein